VLLRSIPRVSVAVPGSAVPENVRNRLYWLQFGSGEGLEVLATTSDAGTFASPELIAATKAATEPLETSTANTSVSDAGFQGSTSTEPVATAVKLVWVPT